MALDRLAPFFALFLAALLAPPLAAAPPHAGRGADGHITGFVERRETWDIAWKRLP